MQQENTLIRNKGGRPKKAIKRNIALTVKCSVQEKIIISDQAKMARKTISEYLRTIGLSGNPVMHVKAISPDALKFCGALNHVGALLNQVAKKRNSTDELDAFERADLKLLLLQIKEILETIKTGLR